MSKLKLNKKAIALLLTGTLALGGSAVAYKNYKSAQETKPTIENQIGHSDINPIINFGLDEEDFVILDMGDHDSVRTHFDNVKAKYCNDHDITLGVIISSDSADESSIYDDVEYVKNLIRKYDINFPVYLDINRIIENDDLNNEMKTKLIKDFVEKCSANNIYVGLYGTDTNLTRVKKYCKITEYDAYLVMDDEQIKYDGSYNIYQDLSGNIRSSQDLSTVINRNNLNDKTRLLNDGTYEVGFEEDITDIALKYGMSVNELLQFNDLTRKDIVPGTYIRIPSIVDNVVASNLDVTYQALTEPLRGCDLSYAQGSDIDWDKLQENFEFVIIRSSQGLSEDATFESNALNASQHNIPLGVYCYNNFTLKNCTDMEEFAENQRKQANYTLELLKNKRIDYPVYLDIEGSLSTSLDKDSVTTMLDTWSKTISSAGYEAGIYCNQSGYRFLQSQVDYDISEKMHVWIAGGDQYTGETRSLPLDTIVPSASVKENVPNATIIQATDSATGAGAGNGQGHLDINYSYYDYTAKEIVGEQTIADQSKEFTRIDQTLVGGAATAVGVAAAGAGIFGTLRKKKKNKVHEKKQTKTKR